MMLSLFIRRKPGGILNTIHKILSRGVLQAIEIKQVKASKMRKSRISFSINKKQAKNEGGGESSQSNVPIGPEPPPYLIQQSTLKPSNYFACRFCCKRFKSEKQYETHSKTKKHGKAVAAGMASELTKSRTCAGCHQSFETRLQLTQHCKRYSHMPLVQKTALKNPVYGKPYTEAEQEDPFVSIKYYSPYYCEVCDLDCVSEVHYGDHVKCARHEKAMEKRAEQGKGVLVDFDTSEVDTSEKCLVIMNKVESATETVSAYYCGICDMDCRSELAYTEHVTSKDHQVRMQGHGQMKISCDLCCMTFNSENNHKMHLRSKKHANNLAARQRLLPLETDPEKESVHDLRDKIKRTISPPLENFDKIKVNIATDSAEDDTSRSVVVDINADEEDGMNLGKPHKSLSRKEKKELEKKLKEDEEERDKWAKKREQDYPKKKAEILKSSKWDSKVDPSEPRGRGKGRGQPVNNNKYKWVSPKLKNPAEKSESNIRERDLKDSHDHGSRDRSSRDHGSRERYKDDSKRDGSKSDRRDRRKGYDDKYASDSENERTILKKGERKRDSIDDENDDLRNVINKQREMTGGKSEDEKGSLVFDYGHQSMDDPEKGEEKRAELKRGFFGGAFAHLNRDDTAEHESRQVRDSYAPKIDEVREPEKPDVGKNMERTLLLELLKRQFPDIRYLTERQGGLELMQKIFGAQGMMGGALVPGMNFGETSPTAVGTARSIASDEGSVKSAQFKQDLNVLPPLSEEVAPPEENKMERQTPPKETRDSRRRDRRSRSRSPNRSRRRRSRSRSDSRGRSRRDKYSSRKRSRSSSRDRSGKRSRRTPSPDKRKREKNDKSGKNTDEKDQSKNIGKDIKDGLTTQVKTKSKEAKEKVIAKWTVSNWSGGNEESGEKEDEKIEKKNESKKNEEKEDKKNREDSRKRKEESTSDNKVEGKKRQRTSSKEDKIFEDASDYEKIPLEDLKEQFKNDYDGGEDKRRSDAGKGKVKQSDQKSSSKSNAGSESKGRGGDEKKRRKERHDKRSAEEEDAALKQMVEMRDSLQKDLLANLAKVESLGRGLPPPGPSFPVPGGPFMPPLAGPPLSGPPLSGSPLSGPPISGPHGPGLGLYPGGGPFPPPSHIGPDSRGLEEPPLPINPNSYLKYLQPNVIPNLSLGTSGSSASEIAMKNLLSQVSALGGSNTIPTSSVSGLRPSEAGSQKLPSVLHRLGEEYSDEFETEETSDESSSKPLKSILKKQSKFNADAEQSSSGLPKHAVGAEYVVNTGEQAKYFCQLCDVQFATSSAKNLHLRGPKHLAMFMKHKSPLIDEMIRQAMGGPEDKRGEEEGMRQTGDEEEKRAESQTTANRRDLSPGRQSPETRNESSERERSISPYSDTSEPRLYVDKRTGRVVQTSGYFSDEKATRSVGKREQTGSREDQERSREGTPVVSQLTSGKDPENLPSKHELSSMPTADEYDRLSQRAKDVLSREEYAQLPASTRKLLLLETSDKDKEKELGQAVRPGTSDETAGGEKDYDKTFSRTTVKDNEDPKIKDYEKLSARAKSLVTREEYERLPERDKEYLSREEYLTREDYDKQTAREAALRDQYDEVAARERLARELATRETYERLPDRERLVELDRLSERDRLAIADRDRLALADRERLADFDRLSDRDRLAMADRDRLAMAERDRLSLADRERLVDRDRLAQRDLYDRYPARDDPLFPRSTPDDYMRGRPGGDYGRYMDVLDDDLAKRMEDQARQRMREDYGRPLPRGGYPDSRDYRDRRDPRDERPPPGREYRAPDWEMGRSHEMYPRDTRVVSRGDPSGFGDRRPGAPQRDWPRAQERPPSITQDPSSGGEPARVPEGERRLDETTQKAAENSGRFGGAYEARPPIGDRREVTDTRAYRDQYDEGEGGRYRSNEAAPNPTARQDQYDYGYDTTRRGGHGGSRGQRGRGMPNRGGPRGHPRNAGYNRGQPRRGGQGRY